MFGTSLAAQAVRSASGNASNPLETTMFGEIRDYFTSGKCIWTLIILAAGIVILCMLRVVGKKQLKKAHAQNRTMEKNVRIIMNVIKIVVIVALAILILQVNGLNITSLVAGLSLTSVIVGFALQDLLSDWINGITIMSEHFFSIGDVVRVDDVTGRVMNVNLKMTQLEEIYTGNIISINNRQIKKAEKLHGRLDVQIPISYDLSVAELSSFITEIIVDVRKLDGVISCIDKGIQKFGDSLIYYMIRLDCEDPFYTPQTNREVNNIIRKKYEERGWDIPFPQMDIHIKDAPDAALKEK